MSTLDAFTGGLPGFASRSNTAKIEAFGWYLHEVKNLERFSASDLTQCYDALHISRPSNIHAVLRAMCERKPARMLRDSKGYRLSASTRSDLATIFPVRVTSVVATNLLAKLLERVVDPAQRAFLNETLVCFNHQAYRAAIVMAWNLAFTHVIDRIFSGHLATFNTQLVKVLPKAPTITKRSDFDDLKDSKIIEIARGAGALSGTSAKILTEKLNKRNTSAHPSAVVIAAVSAEEVIFDLVENILLKQEL